MPHRWAARPPTRPPAVAGGPLTPVSACFFSQTLAMRRVVVYFRRPMATYRVLVSDPISEKGVDALRNAPGISVDVNTGLKPEELLKIIGDYHGLVVRSQTKVTPEVFAAATNLKVIGRAGVGVDNINASSVAKPVTIYLTPGYWGYVGASPENYISAPGQITINWVQPPAMSRLSRCSTRVHLVYFPQDTCLFLFPTVR